VPEETKHIPESVRKIAPGDWRAAFLALESELAAVERRGEILMMLEERLDEEGSRAEEYQYLFQQMSDLVESVGRLNAFWDELHQQAARKPDDSDVAA